MRSSWLGSGSQKDACDGVEQTHRHPAIIPKRATRCGIRLLRWGRGQPAATSHKNQAFVRREWIPTDVNCVSGKGLAESSKGLNGIWVYKD